MRLFVLARHAESELNLERRVNGDPARRADLTDRGREEAMLLGDQVAQLPFDLCVHTRFPRTEQTAAIALRGRAVPTEVEPLLDDIDVGELEGAPIERYREVKRALGRRRPFPGGESLDAAALRYAAAFERLLAGPHRAVLVVCHEIPLRYALNGALGSDSLDGPFHELPNATPYLFADERLARAAARIRELAGAPAPS